MSSPEPLPDRCGAKLRNRDAYCEQYPEANGRCRLHGGRSLPAGPDHPRYRHGRYSRLQIPSDLAQRVVEAESDPELLSLRSDVALLQCRIDELLEMLDTQADRQSWEQVRKLTTQIESAIEQGDEEAVTESLAQLKEFTHEGQRQAKLWQEIDRLLDRKRKLAESERKAQLEAGRVILTAQAILMMDHLMQAVREHVTSQESLTAIQRELNRLIGVPGR